MKCRHCGELLRHTFLDLGFAPPSNAYLNDADLRMPEVYLPLKLKVCHACWLVQTEDYTQAKSLFSKDYAYFSSTSSSWLSHASRYAADITRRLALDKHSFVIEIASNDGYLLKNFVAAGIPCLGIEPTASTAIAAEQLGVPVLREFFGEAVGRRLAEQGKQADLIAGKNVYAHVPDINDFTRGLTAALKPGGTITLEFPHLMRLVEHTQFDTVYHEHFSYLSLFTVRRIFGLAGLRVADVEELPTHGGSLRVYGCHAKDSRSDSKDVARILASEREAGLQDLKVFNQFQRRADAVKDQLVSFLIEQKRAGRKVAAYGAAAKGNYLPGSHIPIFAPERLKVDRPDLVLVLPWNIADEVVRQNEYIRAWGGKFVCAVPELTFA
jgi:SAM-dependent methyltransferase